MPSIQDSIQAAHGELRQQVARRTAEQAAARATALEAEAKRARQAASAAEETAEVLESRAGQARTHADSMDRALTAIEGSQRAEQTLSAQFLRISQTLREAQSTVTGPSATPSTLAPAFETGSGSSPGQVVDTAA